MAKQQVVLITGASSGIGKATAERLLAEGHIVYAAARRVERMAEIKEAGGVPVRMDVTAEQDIVDVVAQIMREQGRIDVLFNNAGFGQYGSVEDVSMERARYQFEVCLFGLARLTQEVLPQMRKQGSGTIVNTSSMGGKMYTPLGAWYHAAKHALEGWSDCLRLEVEQFGIRVVVVEPGLIETEFGEVVGGPIIEITGDGPYRPMVDAMLKQMGGGNTKYSPPSLIADVVSKAITARKPKTRYVAGSMGKMLIRMRRLLGDRRFDKLLRKQMMGQ